MSYLRFHIFYSFVTAHDHQIANAVDAVAAAGLADAAAGGGRRLLKYGQDMVGRSIAGSLHEPPTPTDNCGYIK